MLIDALNIVKSPAISLSPPEPLDLSVPYLLQCPSGLGVDLGQFNPVCERKRQTYAIECRLMFERVLVNPYVLAKGLGIATLICGCLSKLQSFLRVHARCPTQLVTGAEPELDWW